MRQKTYDKVNALFSKRGGYLNSREILSNGITTIQVRKLLAEEKIERISHGNYWNLMPGKKKPKNWKMIEACMTNPRAIICSLSACYYHGLLDEEPEELYVATARTDRSAMKLKFPVSRHYFSVLNFEEDMKVVRNKSCKIRVYEMDRSVCDCIRLEKEIGKETVQMVVDRYKQCENRNVEHLLEYAERMRYGKIAREYLEG